MAIVEWGLHEGTRLLCPANFELLTALLLQLKRVAAALTRYIKVRDGALLVDGWWHTPDERKKLEVCEHCKPCRDAAHDIDGFVPDNSKDKPWKEARPCVHWPGEWRGRGRQDEKTPKELPKNLTRSMARIEPAFPRKYLYLQLQDQSTCQGHERTAEINANEEINAVAVSRGTPTPAKVCACR